MLVERPVPGEFGAYYANYTNKVPEGDIFNILASQPDLLVKMLGGLSDAQANYRFGPKEWTIKEVVGHLIDVERVFAYRGLCFARNDPNSFPGFEQDDYVRASNYTQRTLVDMLQEFDLLRQANLLQFRNLPAEAYLRQGTASKNPFTVRAVLYILAGHVIHHIGSLQTDYALPAVT